MTQRTSGIQAALYNHPVVIKMINYLNLRGSQISKIIYDANLHTAGSPWFSLALKPDICGEGAPLFIMALKRSVRNREEK